MAALHLPGDYFPIIGYVEESRSMTVVFPWALEEALSDRQAGIMAAWHVGFGLSQPGMSIVAWPGWTTGLGWAASKLHIRKPLEAY